MIKTMEATLSNDQRISYIVKDNPPRGGMKYTYFTPDRAYVVQFFNDPSVAHNTRLHTRLSAILGKYNPTVPETSGGAKGGDKKTADYFSGLFCWPVAIVKSPEFGIVCPTYPPGFFFTEASSRIAELDLKGKEKKSTWFTSGNRKYLQPAELGDFRMMLSISIFLSRSIRRLHQAGLAHSDLSCNNVLIDPRDGKCVIIDIDSLVVPDLHPPEVIGTRGYVAPEVLSTLGRPLDDPERKLPCAATDLHALPVLLYEYLFLRHPLIGPRIYSSRSAEEDDFLALGREATFIENPHDQSNRPKDLHYTIKDLGPILEKLFYRAFVEGLHSPNERPTAMEWERGLVKTWDLLHPCPNNSCDKKWFVLHNENNSICPFCGTYIRNQEIIRLKCKSKIRGQDGQWTDAGEINVTHNTPLFKWHFYSNVFPDEKADRTLQAYICKHNGQWLLVNQNVDGMLSPNGNSVIRGQAILLEDGTVFRASCGENGKLIKVTVK